MTEGNDLLKQSADNEVKRSQSAPAMNRLKGRNRLNDEKKPEIDPLCCSFSAFDGFIFSCVWRKHSI